jgi:hypothetical protein
MIDQIGGWSSGKIGEGCEDGFEVSKLKAHLKYIT